ncbi:hypothetical protein FO519_004052 [Halicephalobus sp. NKZ332]|nr:hypothetical protein FO519_004052 [Halicephalobus sp. NKZ332]
MADPPKPSTSKADKNFNLDEIKSALENIDEQEVVLPFTSLAHVATYIKNKQPKKIIVILGAGISTSAGIPDFRSPGTGLYNNVKKYGVQNAEDVFDIHYFRKNPIPFYDVAKGMFKIPVRPTVAHYFLRLLDDHGHLLRIYTQNIDLLESATGIDEKKIVTAHGSHQSSTCLKCKKKFDKAFMEEHLRFGEELVPHCSCGGVIKPDITFYGEDLPRRFYDLYRSDFKEADFLLIMGTSLTVMPVAGLPALINTNIPRVLINRELVGETVLNFTGRRNIRDYFHAGDTDPICRQLARLLGWQQELESLIKQQNANLETAAKEMERKSLGASGDQAVKNEDSKDQVKKDE